MRRAKKLLAIGFPALLAASFIFLAVASLSHRQALADKIWALRSISQVSYEMGTGERGELSLPHSFTGLAPRTAVTLTARVEAGPGESLFVKSVFAPLRLYVNGELLYEYGQPGSYPAYMNDPPAGYALVALPEAGGSLSLRVEYASLTQRDSLVLSTFYIGEHAALLNLLLSMNGFSFLFSLILIFIGLTMTLIALSFVRRVPSGASFLWLGLFSLSAGIWVLGECEFTSRLLPYPALLYNMAYLGLFCMTIPFLRFGLVVLNPRSKLPVRLMLWVHYVSLTAAIALQLTGLVDFTKSLFWFHVIAPLGFINFAVCLVWEGLRNRNPAAKRFAPAALLLALSAVLELANYWLYPTAQLTVFFQLGLLTFLISLGVVSGHYVRESLHNAAEKNRLEYEMAGMERQLALQRLQYRKMAENDAAVAAQRHDLRHQLAVLRNLNEQGGRETLGSYIDTLIWKIPSGKELRLCENYAVNAVAAYYYGLALQVGIEMSLSLAVPKELENGLESDLCVVVGNLLENAVEACARMTGGSPFIRVNSALQYGVLTLIVDNSFSGRVRKEGEAFLSSKRAGVGLGLASVTAVAKKYGGARFEASGGVFQASVYLRLTPDSGKDV